MNVWVSDHAADRFIERVRPSLDRRQAKMELARLLRDFGRRIEWPDWGHDPPEGDRYTVEISDGIAVVVDPVSWGGGWPLAVTVITRCGNADGHIGRAQWRRRKRGKRLTASTVNAMSRSRRSELRRRRAPEIDEAA